jgi:predicted nucleotidyltransferase
VPRIPHDLAPLLAAYRSRLESRFGDRLLSLRLFGSRARGDHEPDSDADVAVVVRDLTDDERAEAIDLAFAAWLAAGRPPALLAPLVWSEAEQADRLAAERRIALDIEREGIAA